MRAPRVEAWRVNIGDQILNAYGPRTWQRVTEVVIEKGLAPHQRDVMIDTATNRTWWYREDLVPCRRQGSV